MSSYSRPFTNPEILAMAGYQLDPGHSDLDNEQPMSVLVHDGQWESTHLRCLLGDIRKAKSDFYSGLRRSLAASVVVEAAKQFLAVRDAVATAPDIDAWIERTAQTVDDLRAAIAQAEAA